MGLRTSSRRKGTRTSSKNKSISKNKKQQNKPESQQEVAIENYQKNKKQPRPSSLARMKMTTPTKVKTASTNRRQFRGQESPRTLTLKRLNTLKTTPVKSRTCLLPRKPENPRVKFNALLSKWEDMSNLALTPAVGILPRSSRIMEGQSREVLQKIIRKDVCSAIERKN